MRAKNILDYLEEDPSLVEKVYGRKDDVTCGNTADGRSVHNDVSIKEAYASYRRVMESTP